MSPYTIYKLEIGEKNYIYKKKLVYDYIFISKV